MRGQLGNETGHIRSSLTLLPPVRSKSSLPLRAIVPISLEAENDDPQPGHRKYSLKSRRAARQ